MKRNKKTIQNNNKKKKTNSKNDFYANRSKSSAQKPIYAEIDTYTYPYN